MTDNNIVSVITVCLNAENDIINTMESVLSQSYHNFEYIIKDGGSSDKTNEIINGYKSKFENRNIPFKHIITKDKGIYYAMNEALYECSGKWINFMNSGDSFYNEFVLENIFEKRDIDKTDVIYGDTCCILYGQRHYVVINNHLELEKGIGISQQACFVKSSILKNRKFNCNYKILADFDFLIFILNQKYKFKHFNIIVTKYNRRGISSTDVFNSKLELFAILNDNNNCSFKVSNYDKIKYTIKTWFTNKFPNISDLLFCLHDSRRKL